MNTHQQARLERAKADKAKKEARQANKKERTRKDGSPIAPLAVVPSEPTVPAEVVAEVAAPVGQEPKVAKAKKVVKPDSTVANWRKSIADKRFADGKGVIHLTDKGRAPEPKKKKALERFRLYKEGMTVSEYQKASKEAGLNSIAGALSDVRWDVEKGLITVTEPAA